jgi:hypothetical protein
LRNEHFAEYVSNLNSTDQSIWKPLKSREKPSTQAPPIRKNSSPPGPWAKRDEEKARHFGIHLSEVFTPHTNNPDPEIESQHKKHTKCSEKITEFTISKLNLVIKRLQPRKAPGPDLITARMIQELPTSGLKTLLHILNATFRLD